ncbi:MAG TPA: copper homeostasis protein CutC [Terriglobales bacterium]|jgi:copper homeostasis protein|nr:copper homeostasis protein CutC [Terriglobales bacterium]
MLVEICCGSIDDAIEAEAGGADRIELCSALFLGGLTPSIGTILEAKARLKIPVMVMIRPRAGGFCYAEAEMASMERDAEIALANGADGLVFGILNPDGTVDANRCRRILQRMGVQQRVFHRAFDVTPDPRAALDQLVDLGFTRILTSGQQDTVPEGIDLIREIIQYARGRIEILPGGGIRPSHIAEVVRRTGCTQVHLTAFKNQVDTSTRARPEVTFGGSLQPREDLYQLTDRELVRSIVSSDQKSS